MGAGTEQREVGRSRRRGETGKRRRRDRIEGRTGSKWEKNKEKEPGREWGSGGQGDGGKGGGDKNLTVCGGMCSQKHHLRPVGAQKDCGDPQAHSDPGVGRNGHVIK